MTFGIIGTAGRGDDGECLKDPYYWRSMRAVAQIVATVTKPTRLVSGGAAYADHLAVNLYLHGAVPELALHLPAEWTGHGFKETSSRYDTGRTSNWYHTLFSQAQDISSLVEIQTAIERGAVVKTGAGGFKERNTDIANEADVMLAFTFGDGARLKDGGTLDTMTKFLARRNSLCTTDEGDPDIFVAQAYHYCLNKKQLYSL